MHASFGFRTEGECAVLADPQGRIADRVDYYLLHENTAWLKQADGSRAEGTPSPGAANQ